MTEKLEESQPKQLDNAAIAEAVSALGLPRFTQHHVTVLAAVLGLRRHDKVVLKTTTLREEGLLLLQSNLLLPPVHTVRQGHDLRKRANTNGQVTSFEFDKVLGRLNTSCCPETR